MTGLSAFFITRASNPSNHNGSVSGEDTFASMLLVPTRIRSFVRACGWPEIAILSSILDRKLVSMGRYPSTPTRFSQTFGLHQTRKSRDDWTSNNGCSSVCVCICFLSFNDGFDREQKWEPGEKDVTPWEPTASFHGFCLVKVIWYYNENTLLDLRRYSRSVRDRELMDRGHLFSTTVLSRVCRSFVQTVTQSRFASKVNT